MTTATAGIHHVTAIAGNAQQNLDFYTGVLGLRLVKLTINFDDPSTYHLYYGDYTGRPGTILTFFPWEGAPYGRPGTGQTTTIAFRVAPDSLDYWMERLESFGIGYDGPGERFEERFISFIDPDGIDIELVAGPPVPEHGDPAWGPVPAEHAIRGLHGVVLTLASYERTAALLTQTFGYRAVRETGSRFRYQTDADGPGTIIDVILEPSPRALRGEIAAGTVHHVALRASDEAQLLEIRERLDNLGLNPTPVRERFYFQSVYFREPGGVQFEVATDGPGFDRDEPVEELGTRLKFPPRYERDRESLESLLSPLRLPYTEVEVMPGDDLDFVHVHEPGTTGQTVLLLHGTGGNETDLIPLGRMIAPNSTFISPRGKVLENGMPRYFRRLAEGVFDMEDLHYRTDELRRFVVATREAYGVDPENLTVVGYSNGANIAASMLLGGDPPFRRAILLRAMLPFEPETLPDLSGVSVLINAGKADPLIPADQTERLADLLRQAGASVDLEWLAPGHGLVREDVDTAKAWLER